MSIAIRRTSRTLLAALAALLIAGGFHPARAAEQCNAYFPLSPDARWVYEEGQQGSKATMRRTISVQSVSTTAGVTEAELLQVVSLPGQPDVAAGRAVTKARCDSSGVTLTVDGSAGLKGETPTGIVKAKLPGLPPADELRPGYSWRGDTDVETMEGGNRVIAKGARGSRVEGVEPVKVPAGTFPEALRVATAQTLNLDAGGQKHYARQHLLEWYVRGIGLVKRETRTSQGPDAAVSVEELQSFSGLEP